MSALGRAAIKAYFEGGDIPTEAQYIDTWDSFFNLTDDTTGNIGVTSIQFDPTPTGVPADSEGLMYFNSTSKTMNLVLAGGVVMQIGQEMPIYVKNTSGSAVADGDAVYVSGTTGVHLVVGLADASDLTKSSQVGLITTAAGIANNGFGFVARFGAVRGLNASGTPVTETWNEGDLLYLSATTPGTLSNSAPGTPHYTVEMGLVVNNSATVGVIGVDPKQPHAANVALGTSNLVGPTQGAVKTYVDAQVAAFRGGARVSSSSALTLTTGVGDGIQFDTEAFDTDSFHSTVLNTERFTIPAGVNYVEVFGYATIEANATGDRKLHILKGGSELIAQHSTPAATIATMLNVSSGPLAVSAGEYFELFATQTSGGDLDVLATAINTSFSIVVVG